MPHTGHDAGPGNCMWADEFAMSVVSRFTATVVLIVDDQAMGRRGLRNGKRVR